MKGVKKCFGLLLVLFITFGLLSGVCSEDANATSITNGIYSTAIYTKNFSSQKTTYSIGPLDIGTPAYAAYALNEVNLTGLWDYTQALSFPNPYSNKTGTGYTSSLYFTMHSVGGNFLNRNLNSLMASVNLGFEHLNEDLPYCSRNYEARVQDYSTVQFVLRATCAAGSYPANTSFDTVEAYVNYEPDSIFWCANDNPSQLCGSSFGITFYNIDYYFSVLTNQTESDSQTIINQNQTIINQNDIMINQQQQTYDWLTDNSAPSADTSALGQSAGWLPAGPVDSILTLPVTLAQGIVGVFTGTHTCTPIVLPFSLGPYNESLTIPCMDEYFRIAQISILWNAVGSIIAAFIVYDTLKWLYKFVDDTLTLRENNSGLWGGL